MPGFRNTLFLFSLFDQKHVHISSIEIVEILFNQIHTISFYGCIVSSNLYLHIMDDYKMYVCTGTSNANDFSHWLRNTLLFL